MHLRKIIPLLVAILAMPFFMMGQTTTSSVTGTVKNKAGEALLGASITATHVPTGTVYTTSARTGGRFDISNMNPGGPYRIVTSFVGYENDTKEDVYLALGETQKLDVDLGNKANQLSEVVVASSRATRGSGTETTIGRDKMQNMPTVGRNLQDYMRATPQFKMSSAGSASSEGAMSFAGQNVRYNSFYIDGAVNNDVFGLAYSGTNGGQSGIAPISIDAIDQFQVNVSPYNASLGNFTGAAINAITKSGTNELHGSAYYIYRNEKLSGKTPTGPKDQATKLSPFDNKTYGFTLGGPIVKNKAFFFLSAELQRDQTPQPFDFKTYQGNVDAITLQRLKDTIAARGGGYNAGTYDNNQTVTEANRITGKIDWNLSSNHKLALSYRYNEGTRSVIFASTPTSLTFSGNGYLFPSTTHSASAELKSTFSRGMSNRLLATFTNVEDDRGPIGSELAFPVVQITDGPSRIFFGTEANSTFNYLKQNTYNLVDQFKFNIKKHSMTAGVEAEYYKAFNSFISNTAGNYQYANIDSFFQNKRPIQYTANFPLIGSTDEKTTDAAAKFDILKGALFLNDEIRTGKNFTLTLGLRADYYDFITKPRADPFAIDSALPKFAQYYDLQGAVPGQKPNVPVALSPRVGFTYNIPSENLTIRGGLGMFAGRIPMVWPGGIYNNNGLSSGGYTISSSSNANLLPLVKFRQTAYTPAELGLNISNAKGQLNLISKEFKMPKIFRASVAFDKRLGSGWSVSVENMITKNINDIYYQNINLLPPTLKMATGPDTRTVYPSSLNIPIRSNGTNPYSNGVYLIRNAAGKKGYSYNFTASVNKSSRTGFNMNASYNYGLSQVLNEAQSSTTNSQWSSMETINGRNFVGLSESDNSGAHRIFAYGSQKFNYLNKRMSTTVTLSYTGQSGAPFSYVYSGQAVRDGINFNDLVFIPTTAQLQAMTFLPLTVGSGATAVTYTDVQQKAAFETFLESDKYFRTHRGGYADRNSHRTPFTHVVDLKIAQNFNVKVGDKTYGLEVAYSMFNFTNFLNRDWGRQYVVANDNYSLLNFSYTSATNLTPRYQFNPTVTKNTAATVYQRFNPSYTARWLSQLEFRVRF
ncbi:MAG: outer rane receptor for ferrienterochelin and colicin [Ferruginibacter sp.]|nr:outer rane receptor for ferrienterochelin and colicin [Ferruginibacter sp.]